MTTPAARFFKAWATMKRIERGGDWRQLAEYREQMRNAFPDAAPVAFAWQAQNRVAIR